MRDIKELEEVAVLDSTISSLPESQEKINVQNRFWAMVSVLQRLNLEYPPKLAIMLLRDAEQELTKLRETNSLQAARLEMFDSMMLLFKSVPNFPSQAMSVDTVWPIRKFLEEQKHATAKTNGQ